MKLRTICILFVLVVMTTVSVADNLDDALQATNSGDYIKAYQLFLAEAEKGNAAAQRSLGLMCSEGLGVPQNNKKAIDWYSMAAQQGDKRAQYYLGGMFEEGLGVPRDYKDAAKWYRLSALQGHTKAQYKLGVMYLKGQGVLQSSESAYAWWSIAAANGDKDAQRYKKSAEEQMSSQQIEKAQQIAKQLWAEIWG